jgi:hypothetical protein
MNTHDIAPTRFVEASVVTYEYNRFAARREPTMTLDGDARSSTLHSEVGQSSEGAVVDPSLRVHGITSLRVANASIMLAITNGNANAPTRGAGSADDYRRRVATEYFTRHTPR